jgi:excisionase family DNA binding protein
MSLQPAAHNLFTTEEAGLVLRMSRQVILDRIADGTLAASFVGRRYLIAKAEIDRYVESLIGQRKK